MTKTKTTLPETISDDLEELRRSVEDFDASVPERIGSPSVGDVVRQGDLYLVCLESPQGRREVAERQLAPGTTQGSRHVAEGDCVIRVDEVTVTVNDHENNSAMVPSQLIGPAIECRGEVEIAHPQHQNKILPAGTNWAVVYQRKLAEEIRRIQD